MARIVLVAVALLVGLPGTARTQPGASPNILLFISDDHGWSDYGFLGHEFARTPNIDRLAAQGVVFTNGYASASTCLPALRTLLAGIPSEVWNRVARDIRAIHGEVPARRESRFMQITLPRRLRDAGYSSFAGGKMWEGSFADAGFDAGTMKTVHLLGVDGAEIFARDSMDALFDWIDEQPGPWFAWVAPMLPHAPYDPPPDLLALYEDLDISEEAKRYYANLLRMDERLGEALAYLEDEHLADDTVVIYLADNGWEQRLQGETPLANSLGDERGKASLQDRGFRTPIIVRGPGIGGPRTYRSLVDFEDVYATILDYGGAQLHDCTRGRSLRRLAEKRGHGERRWPRRQPFAQQTTLRVPFDELEEGDPPFEHGLGFFVRTRRYAYTRYLHRGTELLFDMLRDPLGEIDLSASHAQLLPGLRARATRAAIDLAGRSCSDYGDRETRTAAGSFAGAVRFAGSASPRRRHTAALRRPLGPLRAFKLDSKTDAARRRSS